VSQRPRAIVSQLNEFSAYDNKTCWKQVQFSGFAADLLRWGGWPAATSGGWGMRRLGRERSSLAQYGLLRPSASE